MPRGTRSRLRPLPPHLRMRRVLYREYARFYGTYRSMTGKTKRFSFAVKVDPRLSPKAKYEYIVMTCNALLDRYAPQHKQGQIFATFNELLNETPWFRVRKILRYKAGMRYER